MDFRKYLLNCYCQKLTELIQVCSVSFDSAELVNIGGKFINEIQIAKYLILVLTVLTVAI